MNSFISIIIPVYNEEQVLPLFHTRLGRVLDTIQQKTEIIYINDGSKDHSLSILRTLQRNDQRVAFLNLSRNFGKEAAMTAGLDYARGDAVIIIDADLQDPPELIPSFIQEWQQGYDMVYGQRLSRDGETRLKKFTAFAFYRVIRSLSNVEIPNDTGDFRLLSRRAVEALRQLQEQNRFMKGMFAWIGFPHKAVKYHRDPRQAGATKWNYWRLWNFALEGITSFSDIPLKIASYLGLLLACFAFGYGGIIIAKTLMFGDPVPGYPSLMTVILFLGGIQLIALGIIGEYLGRLFIESKKRPLYFVQEYNPSSQRTAHNAFLRQRTAKMQLN